MRNKTTKKNMTSFDYKARNLGIIGGLAILLSLAVLLPVATSISNKNVALTQEIKHLNEEIEQADNSRIIIDER